MSKARNLSDFISDPAIDATEIGSNAITTDKVADLAVTHAKLHTDMDLSGKTVTLPTDGISGNSIHGGVISSFASTGIDDNASSTAVTITSGGNVGIGIVDPTADLQLGGSNPNLVFGTTGNELTYLQRYNDDFYIYNKETTGKLFLGTANQTRLTVNATGNVGIGTTSPQRKLHSVDNGAQLRINRIDGADDTWEFYSWDDGLNIYPTDAASTVWFGRDGQNTDVSLYNGRLAVNHSAGVPSGYAIYANGSIWAKAGAGDSGGLRMHTNSGINVSSNVMSFHTGQTNGFKFNNNSDGADDNNTIVHITPSGNIIQQANYDSAREIPEVYDLAPYTINVGGYRRSWTKLFQFSAGGQQECQFRIHFQGDHNYNHLFTCQGQVHQWSGTTGIANFYIIGQGGNLTGEFVFTSDHSCWWRPSGNWSDTGRIEVLSKTSGCTIMTNTANNLVDGSNPSGTIYSFSGTGSTSGEINWGA